MYHEIKDPSISLYYTFHRTSDREDFAAFPPKITIMNVYALYGSGY
jgi:hypothetical protein